MNKLPVYLYPNTLTVLLDLDENRSTNNVMYQRKLTIQKGYRDSIQIQFKNSDQKPLPLSSTTYVFDMIDPDGRELVLSKPLVMIDDTVVYTLNQAQTGTNGTLTFDNTTGIIPGQAVTGFGLQANTIVTNVQSGTVSISAPTIYQLTTSTTITFSTVAKRGLALAQFEPIETINLSSGDYKFIVKQDNGDGTFTPAYANTYYGITGEVSVVDDGFPIGFPVQTIARNQLTTSGSQFNRTFGTQGYNFYSGWFRPISHSVTTSTAQSVLIALSNFAGTVTVEGTLDNVPSGIGAANAQAFTITNYVSTLPTQGNVQLSWNTAAVAIRVVVVPASDAFGNNYYPSGNPPGSNINQFPSGFVDSIQYFS